MTAYQRGGYYEVRTANLFRTDGYHVWQTRGSKGAADLIAVKPRQLVLIQVKSGSKPISHAGWNELHELARLVLAEPIVADWTPRTSANPGRGYVLRLRRISGPHVQHSQWWPYEPWHLDELEASAARHPGNPRRLS